MVINGMFLVYPGEHRCIRSAFVFFLKPIFAMLFTDAVRAYSVVCV